MLRIIGFLSENRRKALFLPDNLFKELAQWFCKCIPFQGTFNSCFQKFKLVTQIMPPALDDLRHDAVMP